MKAAKFSLPQKDCFTFDCIFLQRIIQNSFKDGLANPCDTESLKNAVVNADIDSKDGFPGSTFLLTQKFKFNWVALGGMDQVLYDILQNVSTETNTF